MRTLPHRPLAAAAVFLFLSALPLGAETFRFKFREGDAWRVNSLVHESVYVNRRLSHTAEITNRITVKVSDLKTDEAGLASARHDCVFMTSERNSNRSFEWGREYASAFRRDGLGNYDISAEYFMPVVRNVPLFPEGDVQPGTSWKGRGEEAHDLRDGFGIMTPFKVPFEVTYTYVGPHERNGRIVHLITAEYSLFFDSPETVTGSGAAADLPATTMGWSRQKLWWDNERGYLPSYSEEFRIQLQLSSGTILEFRGTAEAETTVTETLDRAGIAKSLNEEISRLGIPNASAAATDEGVTLSLENIQFEADSARLLPGEREKIRKLAAFLERYPDRELLITGHTALAGTAEARKKLSEERAAAVARYLVEMGVRSEYSVYTRGFGAEHPIAPNDTEANMARNRRVEITILDE